MECYFFFFNYEIVQKCVFRFRKCILLTLELKIRSKISDWIYFENYSQENYSKNIVFKKIRSFLRKLTEKILKLIYFPYKLYIINQKLRIFQKFKNSFKKQRKKN